MVWIEVTSVYDENFNIKANITGTVESKQKPYKEGDDETSFDYFRTEKQAKEFVREA